MIPTRRPLFTVRDCRVRRGGLFVHCQLAAYKDHEPSHIGTKLPYEQGGYESTRSCTAPAVEEVLMPAMRGLLGVQA